MKFVILTLFTALALAACDGGGDASCGNSTHSFTTTECNAIALSHGCTSGEAFMDPHFTSANLSCQFHGCPAGEITCTIIDGGNDAATE